MGDTEISWTHRPGTRGHVGPGLHLTCFASVEHLECLDCGAWCSLGPSNDRIPRREMNLARDINIICRAWPDQVTRNEAIDLAADEHAGMP